MHDIKGDSHHKIKYKNSVETNYCLYIIGLTYAKFSTFKSLLYFWITHLAVWCSLLHSQPCQAFTLPETGILLVF